MIRREHFASGLCRAFVGFFVLKFLLGKKNFGYSLFKQQGTMLVEETLISDVV